MTHIVYIALGSNLDDRLANLKAAIQGLAPSVLVMQRSAIYETEPWGFTDQPSFLNMVVSARTDLAPLDLLKHVKNLEQVLGRRPTFRNGPRLIDLDILFYDDLILQLPDLVIPHPRLHERAFVLVPLMDIAPDLVHPALQVGTARLVAGLDCSGVKLVQKEL